MWQARRPFEISSKTSGTLKFDDTTTTTLNLNGMMDSTKNVLPQGLNFTFKDSNGYISKDQHWRIARVDNSDNTSTFYLRRNIYNNTINATDVITNYGVQVLQLQATNIKNPNAPVEGPVTVIVQSNVANVGLRWIGNTQLLAKSAKSGDTISLPLQDCTKTCVQIYLKNLPNTVVNDTISMNSSGANANVVSTPAGAVAVTDSGNGYQITVPASVLENAGYGNYPNTSMANGLSSQLLLQGFKTASGYNTTLNLSGTAGTGQTALTDGRIVSLTIAGKLRWSGSPTSNKLKFDAIFESNIASGGVDGADYIALNKYFAIDPVKANLHGFTLKFANGDTKSADSKWKLVNNDQNWYLIRNPGADGKTLDAKDIGQVADLSIVQSSSSDQMTDSDAQPTSIVVVANPGNIKLSWWYYDTNSQPHTTDQLYIKVSSADSYITFAAGNNPPGQHDNATHIKACLKSETDCTTNIVNDPINTTNFVQVGNASPAGYCTTFDKYINFLPSKPSAADHVGQLKINRSLITAQTFEDCKSSSTIQTGLVYFGNQFQIYSKSQGTLQGGDPNIQLKIMQCDSNNSMNREECVNYGKNAGFRCQILNPVKKTKIPAGNRRDFFYGMISSISDNRIIAPSLYVFL